MINWKKQHKKKLIRIILTVAIGIGQLLTVIGGRSWLIWRYSGPSGHGVENIYIPQSYLIPNRYVITVTGIFPHAMMDNVVGNFSLTNINTGKSSVFEYSIRGFWIVGGIKNEVVSISLTPGKYNVSWFNSDDRYEYIITTQGIFNWLIEEDRYPYMAENIALFISILLAIFFVVYAIKNYGEAKRDLKYYQ
ncbi:MAG: hypothetical protein ACXAEX_07715 [Promethearchaeota archaeon]